MSLSIVTLPRDLLSSICDYLPLRELSQLSKTCRLFHQFVPKKMRPMLGALAQKTLYKFIEKQNITLLKGARFKSHQSLLLSIYLIFDEYGHLKTMQIAKFTSNYHLSSSHTRPVFVTRTFERLNPLPAGWFGALLFGESDDDRLMPSQSYWKLTLLSIQEKAPSHKTYLKILGKRIQKHPLFCNTSEEDLLHPASAIFEDEDFYIEKSQ